MFLLIEWIAMMGFIWRKAIAIIIYSITDFIPHMPHSGLARFVTPAFLSHVPLSAILIVTVYI
ncbi:hypothetical protein ADT29_11080 [Xylella fastidiosa]|nr:hypothetical protein ADT29_11080 [Xylella fastidiosa]KXB22340.1 hypothetical protein ADT30_01535 [Xylella fastidiosa]NRP55856.1 hypothetical protein [Xylella fastidiosa]